MINFISTVIILTPTSHDACLGSQMLRKMGWNEGQGLGRDGNGLEESVGRKKIYSIYYYYFSYHDHPLR
jgi:hypothetical protein